MRYMGSRKKTTNFILGFMMMISFSMVWHLTGYGKESIVISSVNITFKDNFGDDEVIDPTVTIVTEGCELDNVLWNTDISKWKPAGKVRGSVIITTDEKVFANNYNRSSCKVSGAQFVSAKALDNNTLEVKVEYIPVVNLGYTEKAGWSDRNMTRATWRKVQYATGYQLNLYADDKLKQKLTVETNSVDLAQYMTQEATYYYEVRAVGYTSTDKKYLKEGIYITSEDIVLDDLGDSAGEWKNDGFRDSDGNYAINCWKEILGNWYYFDGAGKKATGWLFMGNRWYYMDTASGVMLKGWQLINGSWYYLNPASGDMITGWVEAEPGVWYYLYPDGSMANNTTIGGYVLDANGRWIP